ncbi:hypothetical protein V6R21_20115 [Limibacter armeniacum]|uniref:hypothetical protein n=1 Tax=Limibacter armeniacum TaxID=466084 RepID=UPI002FE612A8
MIKLKINNELSTSTGFNTAEAYIECNGYTKAQSQVTANFSIYKSQSDRNAGNTAITIKNLHPYITIQDSEMVVQSGDEGKTVTDLITGHIQAAILSRFEDVIGEGETLDYLVIE